MKRTFLYHVPNDMKNDIITDPVTGQAVVEQDLVAKLAQGHDPSFGKDVYLRLLAQEVLRARKVLPIPSYPPKDEFSTQRTVPSDTSDMGFCKNPECNQPAVRDGWCRYHQ